MLSEEYVKREKRTAELYEKYLDSHQGMEEETNELFALLEENKITSDEFRERALEIGKKYA